MDSNVMAGDQDFLAGLKEEMAADEPRALNQERSP